MRARAVATIMLAALPALAQAQGTEVPLGGFQHDATQQVEITSDRLDLDQAAGTAIFAGTVKVGQGALRLAADRVEVFYAGGAEGSSGQIQRLIAEGNVTLSNGTEAAESDRATYEVPAGTIVMEGDVLLTQGRNALSSQRLDIDLNRGTGRLEGRVQTIFVPSSTPAP
jgi:lipopolysaccharide export system protein LptA